MPMLDSLDVIDVASPCPADWDAMTGDDRVRHCGQCNLNVYNLSDMTEREAMSLVNKSEGRMCVRFFRREDGTMITRDCPVGLAALRRSIVRIWAKAAALAGAMFAGGLLGRWGGAEEVVRPEIRPEWIKPIDVQVQAMQGRIREVKGDICITPKITVDLIVASHTPAKLIETIKTVKQKVGCKSLGQPDPDEMDAMSERDRQTVERLLEDATQAAPAAGSPEHKRVIRYFQALVKRYPAAQLQVAGPQPAVPHAEVKLGKMIVRE